MHPRAQSLIADLDLQPHPEGGYYREIFRSESRVQLGDRRAERSALTAIYFLLVEGQHSGWHQVLSDEVWSHLEGDALELLCFDATNSQASTIALGRFSASAAVPIHVVPAGVWQAARTEVDEQIDAARDLDPEHWAETTDSAIGFVSLNEGKDWDALFVDLREDEIGYSIKRLNGFVEHYGRSLRVYH
jgi:predicted cupin superfamily sugar epimerase